MPLTPIKALGIGIAQCIAILPGVSRSGSTLTAGLMFGLSGEEAARFSFLLSVPAILGAAVLDAPEIAHLGGNPWILVGSFLVAAASGYVAIRLVWKVMQRGRLAMFAPYCALLGLAALLLGGALPR
jgi:undecaprenyl-diphosphatase